MLKENMEKWGKWVKMVVLRRIIGRGYLLVKMYDEKDRKGKQLGFLKIGRMIVRR